MGSRPGELTAVLDRVCAEDASRGEEWMYHWASKAGLSAQWRGAEGMQRECGCSPAVPTFSGYGVFMSETRLER